MRARALRSQWRATPSDPALPLARPSPASGREGSPLCDRARRSGPRLGPPLTPRVTLAAFLVFCRVGGCLMLAPGFSASQIPTQIRLFIALGVALSLAPTLIDRIPTAAVGDDPVVTLRTIGVELLIGGFIGALARIFFLALETMASAAAQMLGFANPFGFEVEQGEQLAPLATLISFAAITLVFILDLHWELIRGLAASYDVMPVGGDFPARFALRQVADALGGSFRLGLRIASPYVIYALIVNLALALIGRLTPQIQVFYVATPFVAAGGLLLLYVTIKPAIEAFLMGFAAWLAARVTA